ncbi:Interleukin 17-like protein [Holothuria leucospilota]|uniref:Interleukin 17-like protein n=1 Tax=Holothuria leucospilota TaxID=206669 RepID=A0A9Q1HK43_HOLLE|nr:Interleukin 17-like protein [Holothuria leucospilota]
MKPTSISCFVANLVYTFFVVTSFAESHRHSVNLIPTETNELTAKERVNRDVRSECTEPTQDELLQLLGEANVMNSLVESGNEESTRWSLLATIDRISEGTPSCTEEDLQSSSHLLSETLNLRTTCPWEYITNVNNTRYPREIPFAVCKCSSCVSETGSSFFSTNGYCQPVIEMKPVLIREECVNNQARYALHEEPVSVGCVCERDSEG